MGFGGKKWCETYQNLHFYILRNISGWTPTATKYCLIGASLSQNPSEQGPDSPGMCSLQWISKEPVPQGVLWSNGSVLCVDVEYACKNVRINKIDQVCLLQDLLLPYLV